MIRELPQFPQFTFNESQGMLGIRRWVLDHDDNLPDFIETVCESHWPNYPDCIPVSVQAGIFDEGGQVLRSPFQPRRLKTLGPTPAYNKLLVVAQYLLHRMTNCWPDTIPKPWHPVGSTLSLRIRGSGQMLVVTPAGMNVMTPLVVSGSPDIVTPGAANATRLVVPIAEYHVSCDRMTRAQVDVALAYSWDLCNGCVNSDPAGGLPDFLGAPAGTLLMDGYEITETMACHPTTPLRYCMTAVFKKRIITAEDGTELLDSEGNHVSWNHDFINILSDRQWGWKRLKLRDGDSLKDRYPSIDFSSLFGLAETQDCGTDTSGGPQIDDDYFCDGTDPDTETSADTLFGPGEGY